MQDFIWFFLFAYWYCSYFTLDCRWQRWYPLHSDGWNSSDLDLFYTGCKSETLNVLGPEKFWFFLSLTLHKIKVIWFDLIHKGSGTLLVRLYKDAGTPSTECSPTKFWKALKSLSGLIPDMLEMSFGYRHYVYRKCPTSLLMWQLRYKETLTLWSFGCSCTCPHA